MNREFARILVCLMDEKLNLPSMILESIEENLVKGNFDKVYEYYQKRITELKGENKMNRIFGMMPRSEIQKEKWYLDQNGLTIGVQAGPHGWTIMWADGGTTYRDIDANTDENFQMALDTLKEKGFSDLKEEESREEICEEVCLEK